VSQVAEAPDIQDAVRSAERSSSDAVVEQSEPRVLLRSEPLELVEQVRTEPTEWPSPEGLRPGLQAASQPAVRASAARWPEAQLLLAVWASAPEARGR